MDKSKIIAKVQDVLKLRELAKKYDVSIYNSEFFRQALNNLTDAKIASLFYKVQGAIYEHVATRVMEKTIYCEDRELILVNYDGYAYLCEVEKYSGIKIVSAIKCEDFELLKLRDYESLYYLAYGEYPLARDDEITFEEHNNVRQYSGNDYIAKSEARKTCTGHLYETTAIGEIFDGRIYCKSEDLFECAMDEFWNYTIRTIPAFKTIAICAYKGKDWFIVPIYKPVEVADKYGEVDTYFQRLNVDEREVEIARNWIIESIANTEAIANSEEVIF